MVRSARKSMGFFLVSLTVSPEKFEGRSAMALPGKTKSERRSTFFGFFSETRGDTLKSPMVNLVRLAEIYEKVHEHFSRISERFAAKA